MLEKLVRDKIAEFVLKERGEVLTTRVANSEEITYLLKQKIMEEANEVFTSQTKRIS